jgi:hypothetical protein
MLRNKKISNEINSVDEFSLLNQLFNNIRNTKQDLYNYIFNNLPRYVIDLYENFKFWKKISVTQAESDNNLELKRPRKILSIIKNK